MKWIKNIEPIWNKYDMSIQNGEMTPQKNYRISMFSEGHDVLKLLLWTGDLVSKKVFNKWK